MTDSRPDDRRVDLRQLDLVHDAKREDAIVAAVMARLPHAPQAVISSAPADLLRLRRVMLAAAAVLAAIATATVFNTRPRDVSTDVIASWTQSSHVPTNGELLTAYHGYRP